MAKKIGYDGVSTSEPKQTLDTSSVNTTSSKKPKRLTDLPKDINVNASKPKKGKEETPKNPSENVNSSEGLKSTDFSNSKNRLSKMQSGIDSMPVPTFAKRALKNRANDLNRRLDSRIGKVKSSIKNSKDKIDKIKKFAKVATAFIKQFGIPIAIALVIIIVIIPGIIAIAMQVGNSPHYYCNLDAPPQVKASKVYQQYCGVSGGNESIAEAAVSLAYHIPDLPNTEVTYVAGFCSSKVSHSLKNHTNGVAPNDVATQLYVDVHDAVDIDSYYASCDRGTCTAVRWAGADDEFPLGPCGTIMDYLDGKGKAKWENLGKLNEDITVDELEPGDIMVYVHGDAGHIGIYVGEEAVQAKYPGSKCTTYAASLNDYCPKLQTIDGWKAGGEGGTNYTIYRNINPEASSKYKDVQF